jgi:hypothetical protein
MRLPTKVVLDTSIARLRGVVTTRGKEIRNLSGLMFGAGAALGPNLDNYHSQFGVLRYAHPAVRVPGFETDWWVPPLFGVAAVLIGLLVVAGDEAFATRKPGRAPSGPAMLAGIGYFCAQYWLSGLLSGGAGYHWDTSTAAVHLPLLATAALGFALFDGTAVGAAVAAATALGGPLIEVALVRSADTYAYVDADVAGVASWIPWVYAAGGPAVGNLARWTWCRLLEKDTPVRL